MSGRRLLRIARQHNVTQIVIGKPLGGRWPGYSRRDPLRWLMRNSGNIDIHMIPSEEAMSPRRETIEERLARTPWRDFGIALVIAAAVTAPSLVIVRYTGYSAIALFYLLAVVFAGTRLRPWPTLFLAALSALLWDFRFRSAAFHFLHRPISRPDDVLCLFRDRAGDCASRDPTARARTSRAPPRRTGDCAISVNPRARGQSRSR